MAASTASPEKAILLVVKLNGKVQPDPSKVTFEAGQETADVPIVEGRFEVPAQIRSAKAFRFTAVLPGNDIDIRDVAASALDVRQWTLLMADRRYEDEPFAVPKHTDIRSTCMLFFDSPNREGTFTFFSQCRTKHQ
ncbi:MAG TPA: hypothetical protein VN862_11310 [Candidatus Acidoferrales bacterium]|nr:hypothetical protein [Candidatus Acidoferrales bacterium]